MQVCRHTRLHQWSSQKHQNHAYIHSGVLRLEPEVPVSATPVTLRVPALAADVPLDALLGPKGLEVA